MPAENLVGRGERRRRHLLPDDDPRAADQRRRRPRAGPGRPGVAARYSDRRKAFGQKIRAFEGVSFKVADSMTLLDAAAALVYAARARAIPAMTRPCRRLVSEAKKVATEAAWRVVNDAMQIMGGIGYTDVYPIERLLRDARLIMIWTGTNEIMAW